MNGYNKTVNEKFAREITSINCCSIVYKSIKLTTIVRATNLKIKNKCQQEKKIKNPTKQRSNKQCFNSLNKSYSQYVNSNKNPKKYQKARPTLLCQHIFIYKQNANN